MNARTAGLIAVALLALAPASAGASRKLSIPELSVPPTGQAGDPLPISGTLRNAGDEQARATVRVYLQDAVGQLRIVGRTVPIGAGREVQFSLNPELPDAPSGDYEIAVCARRLNKHGPTRCTAAPLTIE